MTTDGAPPPAGADSSPPATEPAPEPGRPQPAPTEYARTSESPADRTADTSVLPPARDRAATPPARRAPAKRKSFFRELPGIVITALVISVLIKTFLVQAFYIPSGSMENTLLVNDRVLVNKLADKPDEIHRGDVIVFRDPGGWLNGPEVQERGGVLGAVRDALVFVGLAPAAGEEDLIKRVIGVGGDEVACCDSEGRVTVNGVPLDEEAYLFPKDEPSFDEFDVTVPEGELWVMGDHRSVSEDSRAHQQQPGEGFVPVDDVIGRAFTIVWPLDRASLLRRPDTFDQPRLDASRP
ncbi:MAG TPA: signal peptidase I [Actinomycetes bacterium]|nr:signal peptidase I [Actinomycetes bacterium]